MACACKNTANTAINLVSSNRLPAIVLQLGNAKTGQALNLSAATTTAIARLREYGSDIGLADETLTKIGTGETGGLLLNWSIGTLTLEEGSYELEVTVDWNGLEQTVYDLIRLNLRKRTTAP